MSRVMEEMITEMVTNEKKMWHFVCWREGNIPMRK